MDFLKFINSNAIRNHLKKINYEFTSMEAAFVVWQSKTHKGGNHLKIFIYSSLIIFTLFLGSCAGQESEIRTKENPVPDEAIVSTEVQTTEEIESVGESDQSIAIDDSKDDGWLTYAEKYKTEHRFTDLYIPSKCWLVGKENIVEVMSAGGIDDVTVTAHTAVERVEHLNVGEFTNISVFDKTGKSISIMVSSEDAEKLLELIKKN